LHPFVKQLIATIRRECLDRVFFWNELCPERKPQAFRLFFVTAVAFTNRSAGAPERSGLVSLILTMLRLIPTDGSSIAEAFSRRQLPRNQ
jgi:hypothetical protein